MNYTYKDMKDGLAMLARSQNLSEVFTALLDFILLRFQEAQCTPDQLDASIKRFYHPDAGSIVFRLFNIIGELSHNYEDPLGRFYTEEISNGRLGQFFTPNHVCDFMAEIVHEDSAPASLIYVDPTCGSGRMLLSAHRLDKYQLYMAADLDITCCKMTLVNFMFTCIVGEVCHMNSLSNEFYTCYITSLRRDPELGDKLYPYFIQTYEPSRSYILLKGREAFAVVADKSPKKLKKQSLSGKLS